MKPAALHAALVEADSRYATHWSVCRARRADLHCLTCAQLEIVALNAAEAWQQCVRREAVEVR